MLEVMKKLATLLITLGFISMSCAGTAQYQLLGGNPRVETVKSTIGMTLEDLDDELGTPNGSDTCALPFKVRGQEAMAQGKSFMWNHETTNIPERTARMSGIIVCVMDGIVVAENRQWMIRDGDIINTGQVNTMNPALVQAIMDNLLTVDPTGKRPTLRLPRNKEFEI
jgi:hypothetical protein